MLARSLIGRMFARTSGRSGGQKDVWVGGPESEKRAVCRREAPLHHEETATHIAGRTKDWAKLNSGGPRFGPHTRLTKPLLLCYCATCCAGITPQNWQDRARNIAWVCTFGWGAKGGALHAQF